MNNETLELINGDCLVEMHKLPDKTIDLIITDPPYLLTPHGGGSFIKSRNYIKEIEYMSNGIDDNVLDEMVRVMKKINIYLFCSRKQIPIFYKYFVEKKGCNWDLLEWHKTNPAPVCNNKYLSDTEYIFFAREKGVKVYGSYHTKRTWFITSVMQKEKKLYNHPTVKPTQIIDNLVVNSSLGGETILDPYCGTGSTGVSCLNYKRKFIGIEINKNYYNTAKQRLLSIKNNISI